MRASLFVLATLLLGATALSAQTALAPDGPGVTNQGRDCQTVRTCNFSRDAEVRGCLSSYTCRRCRFVQAKCSIGAGQGPCQKLQCSYGG